MSKFNPTALVLIALTAAVGYLIDDGHGAVVGLAIGLGVVFLASLLPDRR